MQILSIRVYANISNIDADFPTALIIPNKEEVNVPVGSTAYGYVAHDGGSIFTDGREFFLFEDMFFCAQENSTIKGLQGFICIRENYRGIFNLGGPIEKLGRLRYIDGCSDTLLLSPIILGDPCLNYLYVPPHIDQTPHTHPSVRVGIILAGKGYCNAENGTFDLAPGSVFVLPTGEEHSFHTQEDNLRIFIFHPDSDFGPTHETHPMINKTYKDGLSLKGLNRYRTEKIRA